MAILPFKFKKIRKSKINVAKLPLHVAIIMDGNGRWAKKRRMPRSAGHSAGASNFKGIATYCRDIGIKYLTVFAFSTENWRRPQSEIDGIMDLMRDYLVQTKKDLERENIRIRFLGEREGIEPDIVALMDEVQVSSKDATGGNVNIAFNYGGRDEILNAVNGLIAEAAATGQAQTLDEVAFSKRLFTGGIPDPDLIIRPSGEYRVSNFLLWQSAYSELYFTNVLWPDFNANELDKAIEAYQRRSRRFGGV